MREGPGREGWTLLEALLVLALAGLVAAVAAGGYRRYRDATALESAATAARARLAQARMRAVTLRTRVRVRMSPAGALELVGEDGRTLSRTPLLRGGFGLDSAVLRPAVMRFNARGQGAPGSLYLYRGSRGIRVVNNFVGRTRMERFRVP